MSTVPAALRQHRSLIAAVAVAVLVAVGIGWWSGSRVPGRYSVMDMGYLDGGGGPVPSMVGMAGMPGTVGVDTLTEPSTGPPDVAVTLVARQDGDRYTFNGSSPGPVIRAVQGQLVQVRLENASVPAGVTLHWHGLNVPNADDGVAGVTQDAVPVGGSFTYRFRAHQAGTYWYHSHQVSHEQVQRGLFGAIVITPAAGTVPVRDELAVVHVGAEGRTVNGRLGDTRVDAPAGTPVRVRVVNTDNGPMPVWVVGGPFRLLAVDGDDVHGPTPVRDAAVTVTGGGRADLEVTAPARVELGGSAAVVVGPAPGAAPRPAATLDLLTYGTPAPLGFDPAAATRRFTYAIGRTFGLLDGLPGLWWTINGHLFPDVPMFVVSRGDVVTMHIENSSGEVHPMHLHGHHAVVLARNGVPAQGSPWRFDSLDVGNGESYDVAFVADNPGIWMGHCHNLTHAADGLVAHLMYTGVSEPYTVGANGNAPE